MWIRRVIVDTDLPTRVVAICKFANAVFRAKTGPTDVDPVALVRLVPYEVQIVQAKAEAGDPDLLGRSHFLDSGDNDPSGGSRPRAGP